ncbi:helix-turn-helix domain-containing protein [Nocardioides bizhenqiangii]|uniref:Helix-turn-helix transcriptional regulator n=1 Tax=Nocardioides bizhenqiangii TaxID=3095076 RepID=A0ABZ0ZRI8_9ACTN|nr:MULTISPECIES: helix-turn-helix transcriptional regulator [unclassified Nocardioides]MDZ5619599.1 helix-turn-helix transcriptional regulator [Nocardioides sp. HM23]WQQ26386.1 helix-turn-helix transcriptional regulator [Nocardioides sp. HM61]
MGQTEQASSPINLDAIRLIREAFAASGMTQAELSRAAEMPRSTLANILSPTARSRVIHVGQMVKIAVAMGVDPRAWVAELETLERRRRGESGPRRARRPTAPQVQRRAARSRSGSAASAEE